MNEQVRARWLRGLGVFIALSGVAAAGPAFADRHHDHHWHHDDRHDHWHRPWGYDGGYYAPPPVVYSRPYYALPPVVYGPGLGINIHLP